MNSALFISANLITEQFKITVVLLQVKQDWYHDHVLYI